MSNVSRRDLIAGLTAGAFLLSGESFASKRTRAEARHAGAAEYMFEPGLNYLNTAALGPTPRTVLDKVLEAWYQLELDPVMMAYGDGAVHVATDRARDELAGLINCKADELLITRSATDAMNCVALSLKLDSGDRILSTDVEHEGGSAGWEYLQRRRGVNLDLVSIAPGDFDTQAIISRFERAITDRTRAISVSHVITSTGLRMPIAEIAALAKHRGILCIVDGAQAVGGIDVDVKKLGCDAYVGTGHKWLMGPKGTGFLYISPKASSLIQPIQRERGVRFVGPGSGVGSLPLVVGLGAAVAAMRKRGLAAVEKQVIDLRDRAYAALTKISKIQLVSPPPGPLTTALVSFKLPDSVDSRAFRDVLLKKYRIVIKVGEKRWFNGNRISPHIFNTERDIDEAVRAIRTELA
ncbi:MAG TPA: aminotransferase class V-fold PLP-dependent enzyme [Pyrinomonadaceae bacterium]|nr:aminotransferase class V-fold PLP-dependent enzyme [Pyrinomonadaceae bacterium]